MPQINAGPVCSGQKLKIDNKSDYLGKNITLHWTGPGGFTSTALEPVIRDEGTYTVYAQDSTGFSTTTDSRNVTFYRTLAALTLGSDTLKYCDGKTAPPIVISGHTAYDTIITYSNVNLTVVLRKDINSPLYIDVASPNTYYFYFVKRDTDQCESSPKKLVIIKHPRPTVSLVAADTFNCTKSQITIDGSASSQGPSYTPTWSGPGIVSYTTPLKPVVNLPGSYILTVVNTTTACIKTDSIRVKTFVPPATGTPKNNVNVCDTGLFDLYELLESYTAGGHWLDDKTTGRITGQHFFNAAGAAEGFYNFTYKIDSINTICKGGTAACQFLLIRYKNPGVPVAVSICNTESAYNLFGALSGYTSGGTWSSALHSSLLSGNSFQATGVAEGSYSFTYSFNPVAVCASDSTTVSIIVNKYKSPGTGTDQTICSTEPYNLFNALSGADRGGAWTETTSSGRLADSVFDPRGIKAGTFSFAYTFSGSACTVTPATVTVVTDIVPPVISCVQLLNLPMTDFDASSLEGTTSIDSALIISISDNCGKYRLSNSINGDSTLAGAVIPKSTEIISWTVADSGQNIATCETKIKFITVPNIFTPNGDQYNELWDFDIDKEYPDAVILVFDRWGNKVFESDKGYHIKWNGGNAPTATYRYVIMNGKEMVMNGFVNLVR